MALPHPSMNFVPLDTLTASELNQIVANILALSNGTGIGNGAIKPEHLNKTSFGSTKTIYKFDDFAYNSAEFGDAPGGVGPSVEVDVPTSGAVLVLISCGSYGSANAKMVGFAATGANSINPDQNVATRNDGATAIITSYHELLTGLNPGKTTFTLKYRGLNARFFARKITVIPLFS
jgi:hypothetical protein